METVPAVDENDVGKPVYDGDGNRVGMVVRAEDDRVHVDPDPDVTENIAARLGLTFVLGESEDSYIVDAADVESVSKDRVTIRVM